MTDPKTLTYEQIDEIIERAWEQAEGETQAGVEAAETEWKRFGRKCIFLATREQTASPRKPIAWIAADAAEYMADRRARFGNDNIWVYAYDRAPDARFMPVFAGPVEQTASTGEPVARFNVSRPPRIGHAVMTGWRWERDDYFQSLPDGEHCLYAAPVEQAGSPPLVYPAQPSGKEKT